ncbi:C1 family peptidase [Thalassotalea sp. G2M2-11]|uniref:C1 family peptidase n=1 Tax=Thalassotalea sp. G2M2-11 TaxID=2787627 RepID=UPI0019D190CA|nr:C1 family peptidase [Thalassotalea sp. G2M2-11]
MKTLAEVHQHTLVADLPDERDHQFCDIHGGNSADFAHISCPISTRQKILKQCPSKVDLRELLTSEIINQGLLNSCSACAIAVAAELYLVKDGQPFVDENASNIDASQMYVYYHERVLENKIDINAPVFIRNGIKSLFKYGICSEKLWPYPEVLFPQSLKKVIANGTTAEAKQAISQVLTEHQQEIHAAITQTPSALAITQAKKHIINRYCKLDEEEDLAELKLALSKGLPVIFGMMVPKSFYLIDSSGEMVMPSRDEERLGGHALLAVGYDDNKQVMIVRNSWGEEFGDNGYCYMPYEFFSSKYEQDGEQQDNTFSYWCLTHD